ncbi:hypothetical protein C3920_15525 [Novacetimonas pomaceti]|uniref:Uncharacterized protein n=1 Tax=Novacetimonas pomaceti TaxID=2021998 RepID=A0ABX5P256_9PROT|nr:hypothetical protein C3920_15525 [Novacetimonas pomaceti]
MCNSFVKTLAANPLFNENVFPTGLNAGNSLNRWRFDKRFNWLGISSVWNFRNIERCAQPFIEINNLPSAIIKFEKRSPAMVIAGITILQFGLYNGR